MSPDYKVSFDTAVSQPLIKISKAAANEAINMTTR